MPRNKITYSGTVGLRLQLGSSSALRRLEAPQPCLQILTDIFGLFLLLLINVTFLNISATCIQRGDSCLVFKFRPAAGHPHHGQLGVFNLPSLPRQGPGIYYNSLPSDGPHRVRERRESNPDLPMNPATYLCHCSRTLQFKTAIHEFFISSYI